MKTLEVFLRDEGKQVFVFPVIMEDFFPESNLDGKKYEEYRRLSIEDIKGNKISDEDKRIIEHFEKMSEEMGVMLSFAKKEIMKKF